MNRKATVDDIFVQLGATNHGKEDRETNDYYATEPKALKKLLNVETFSKNVWECACGGGHLVNVLKEHNYNVWSTDLVNRNSEICDAELDFLKFNQAINCDIITNPPYKLALSFVEHSLDITTNGNKIAMFLKIQFLESEIRGNFFKKFPPKYVYVFSKRVNCAKNGDFERYPSSAICYAWYIWVKGETSEPIIRWL